MPGMTGHLPHSLLISDLHLSTQQEALTRLFEQFLGTLAPQAEALYILGDLFEYWVGDDTLEQPLHRRVCTALQQLATRGVRIFLMHGNRDFLIGEQFSRQCGVTLLPDPSLVKLYGTPTLLTHGDALCTDDLAYQAFRNQVRDATCQAQFLAQPLPVREAMAQSAREQSTNAQHDKPAEIMDVNAQTVMALVAQYGYPRLIHGHTHRPALHRLEHAGHTTERWVLPDWHDGQGGYLQCDADGCRALPLGAAA